ncbi:MAG: tetratricopeptide repeat protein [Promethearchaeota archaeon]
MAIPLINLSIIERAHENFRNSDFNEALKNYLKVLEMEPDNTAILINIGFVYYFLFDLFKAQEFFETSLKINGSNQMAWFGLWLVARKMGDRDLEIKSLLNILKINEIPFVTLLENVKSFYNN